MFGTFNKKIALYVAIGLIGTFAVTKLDVPKKNSNLISTSVVSVSENVPEENKQEPVDLGIQKATLKKISNPTENFDYYKYAANIVIKNFGGDLENGQLVLEAGDSQKHLFVKNSGEGFSLAEGESYIVEDYELLFDGDYNGGKQTIEIKLSENADYYPGNNKYDVEIFELPPKVESIGLSGIREDGTFELEFNPTNYHGVDNGFEVFVSDSLELDGVEKKYAELESGDKIHSYYRIKNSKDFLENGSWSLKQGVDTDPHLIKFSDLPFEDTVVHYVYIRSSNPENGNYVISNILELPTQKALNKAAFAKFFVEYSGVDIFNDGQIYFNDVAQDAWYSPYVKTLYNLGLIQNENGEFYPDAEMSRGEALKVVLDYFDVDLTEESGEPPYQDVTEENPIYPYTKALFATGEGGVFDENFYPEMVATKNYLKYLIYEYKKRS